MLTKLLTIEMVNKRKVITKINNKVDLLLIKDLENKEFKTLTNNKLKVLTLTKVEILHLTVMLHLALMVHLTKPQLITDLRQMVNNSKDAMTFKIEIIPVKLQLITDLVNKGTTKVETLLITETLKVGLVELINLARLDLIILYHLLTIMDQNLILNQIR